MILRRTVFHSLIATLVVALPHARAAFPTVALKPVCLGQIHSPTTITHAPDGSGRLFICDQPGKIYIMQGGMLLPVPFLNIASSSNPSPDNGPGPVVAMPASPGYSERGLLGLAFHPGFADSLSPGYRKFYVNYNKAYASGVDPGPSQAGDPVDCVTVIAEFQVSMANPNFVDPSSERRLLVFTQPQSNHNGGQLEFGPDGMLYIGTGDGGGSQDNGLGHTGREVSTTSCLGNAQDKTRYLGKILRIDPNDPDGAGPLTYGIPSDNPFFSDPTPGLKKEIYAFGLRNPWRFSFDKRPGGTNRLFCGDVGQGRIEEINLIVSGGNYGWRYKEGIEFPSFSAGTPVPADPVIDPIAMYAHPGIANSALPQLGLSVTGGFVYRGSAILAMQGKYVFGDYGSIGSVDGRLMGLEETVISPPSGVFTLTQALPLTVANPLLGQRVLTLGEDAGGEIYVGLKTNNGVLQLGTDGRPAGSIFKIVPTTAGSLPAVTSNLDNTIFSDGEPTTANGNSNGNGSYLFAGYASPFGNQARRALLRFSLATVPAGASVTSATVTLFCDKQANNSPEAGPFSLSRVSAGWGEGSSNSDLNPGSGAAAEVGDATWRLRQVTAPGSPPAGFAWTTSGGDFAAAPSATTTVSTPSLIVPYSWSSSQNPQLAADVNAWLAAPSSNFGWILIGPEGGGATAKRFISREFSTASVRPKLTVNYAAPPPPTHFESWLTTYFPGNLVGQFVDPNASLGGDGIGSLIKYANGLSPLTPTPAGAGLQATSVFSDPNTICTYTFRRDALATDLTYLLQVSSDLTGWSTIAQSTGGAVPSGTGFVSESTVSGQIKSVTVQETVGPPAIRFVRLRVNRAP